MKPHYQAVATCFDEHSQAQVSIEQRLCGDLFELTTLIIPPGKRYIHDFAPLINLVMIVAGRMDVGVVSSDFQIETGQVWLTGGVQQCTLCNTGERDAVVISIRVQPSMIRRFYERYGQGQVSATEISKRVDSLLPSTASPVVFPSCELTRLALESLRLVSQKANEGLSALKLEELLLLKLNDDNGQVLADYMRNSSNPAQERFSAFMDEHIFKAWSVATYAREFGTSLTSFKKMFRQVYQAQSPKAWINEKRLLHANLLLRTTDNRLVDIALESGFSSQSYFTQMYKAHYGISPTEARQAK